MIARDADRAIKRSRLAAGLCVHCGRRPGDTDHPGLAKYPPHVRRWCRQCVITSLEIRVEWERDQHMPDKAARHLRRLLENARPDSRGCP